MSKDRVLQRLNVKSCLLAICTVGFLLRVFYISQESIWFDEVASFVAARQPVLAKVIETTYLTERTPPLYLLLLHFWVKIFGFSEFSMRFPSALCGFLTIPVMYVFSKSLFDNKVAILSSLFLAISPFHIWYSQEARCFTMTVFLNLLSIVFFLKILRMGNRSSWLHRLVYVSMTCLALYTNYLALFTIIAENIVVSYQWLKKKTILHRWLNLQLLIVLLSVIPLSLFLTKQVFTGYEMGYSSTTEGELRVTTDQSIAGEPSSALDNTTEEAPSKAAYIIMLIRERFKLNLEDSLKLLFIHIPYSFGSGLKYVNRLPYSWSKPFIYLFISPSVLLFVSLFLYGAWVSRNDNFFLLLTLLLVPIIGAVLIVLLDVRPIYIRHTIQSLPLFYVFTARGLCCLPRPKIRSVLLFILTISMMISLSINYFDKKVYKDDWRYITSYVLHDLTTEDFIIFHGEFPNSSFYYYILLDSDNRAKWEAEKPATITIRARDDSLSHFLNNVESVYDRMLVEKERVWVITYYAEEEESYCLRSYLEKDLVLSQRNSNLGRNLLLELYENPRASRE